MGYTTLMGAPPLVEPMLVTFFFRITGFHLSYGCPALSAAFYCYVYLQNLCITLDLRALDSTMLHPKWSLCWLPLPRVNQWVTLQFGVRHIKYCLCCLPPVSESLVDTTLMGV